MSVDCFVCLALPYCLLCRGRAGWRSPQPGRREARETRLHVAELQWRRFACGGRTRQESEMMEGRKSEEEEERMWRQWGKRPVTAQGNWGTLRLYNRTYIQDFSHKEGRRMRGNVTGVTCRWWRKSLDVLQWDDILPTRNRESVKMRSGRL